MGDKGIPNGTYIGLIIGSDRNASRRQRSRSKKLEVKSQKGWITENSLRLVLKPWKGDSMIAKPKRAKPNTSGVTRGGLWVPSLTQLIMSSLRDC